MASWKDKFDPKIIADADERERVNGIITNAPDITPDQAGTDISLGARYNIPAEVVSNDRKFYTDTSVRQDTAAAAEQSPAIQKWVKNSQDAYHRARLLEEDYQNLSLTDKALRNVADMTVVPIADGVANTYKGVYGLAGNLSTWWDKMLTPVFGENNWGKSSADFFYKRASNVANFQKKYDMEGIGNSHSDTYKAASSGISSLYSNLLTLPAGMEMAALKTGVAAKALLGATPMSLIAAGQGSEEARGLGKNIVDQTLYAGTQGLIEAGTEALPLGFLMKDLKAGSPLYKILMHQVATENISEQAATHLGDLSTWLQLHPEQSADDYLSSRGDAAYQTLIATTVSSVLMTGGMHAAGRHAALKQQLVNDAEKTRMHLETMGSIISANKTLQRDSSTFNSFVEAATNDGPLKDVYIDARQLHQSGVAEQLMEVSPSIKAQYQKALDNGQDLRIPIGEYSTNIAGTEYNQGLLDHLKTSPDSMSAAEAKDYMATKNEELYDRVNRAIGSKMQDSEFKASYDKVYTAVLDHMNEVGRFSPEKNAYDATLIASNAAARASQLGQSPEAVFRERFLKISAENVDGKVLAQPGIGPSQMSPEDIEKTAKSFMGPEEKGLDDHYAKARFFKDTQEVADRYAPTHVYDPVTGYNQATEKSGVLQRAQEHVEKTNGRAHYVDADIANLGGINAHFKNVASKANAFYRKMSDILKTNLEASGHKVIMIRHGGDELSAVVLGGTTEGVRAAIEKVRVEIQELAQREGLHDIENGKNPKTGTRGTGIHMGMSEFQRGVEMSDTVDAAAGELDDSKNRAKGEKDVTGKQVETAGDGELGSGITGVHVGADPKTDGAGYQNSGTEASLSGPGGQSELESFVREYYQPVSTRTPTVKAGREDPHLSNGLHVDMDSLEQVPALKEKFAEKIREYMTFKKGPKTTDAVVEAFIKQSTDNLLWLYDQVPEEVRERSRQWYDGGRKLVDNIVKRHGNKYSDAQIAAAFAAMSPKMAWDNNVTLSERIVDIYTDHQNTKFSPKMGKVLDSFVELMPHRKELFEGIRGKTLSELGTDLEKASWVRAYSEAHTINKYRLVTPEGGFSDFKKNKGGDFTKVSWGNGLEPVAKVISILRDGSMANISRNLGEAHKVRNFYNNIYNPNDPVSVTIDTHAVAAANLLPLAADGTEVSHSLSGPGNDAQGLTGTYVLYAEAYRRAAKERGVLPREMQSITWEAGKGLFNPSFKAAFKRDGSELKKKFEAIWKLYTKGKATLDDTRTAIANLSGGIENPGWTESGAGLHEGEKSSSYTEDVFGARGVEGAIDTRRGAGSSGGTKTYFQPTAAVGRAATERSRGGSTSSEAVDSRQESSTRGTSLEGLPALADVDGVQMTFGAFSPAQQAAEKYAASIGLKYNPPKVYVPVDPERSARIAEEFERMEHNPNDPMVKAAYDALAKETIAQYEAVLETGLQVEFITGEDPYVNPRKAILDVVNNNHMWVFPTIDGFGGPSSTADVSGNPLLADTGHMISGKPATVNDLFRVVHDYFGHIKEGVGFRASGEEQTWRSHSAMFTPLAQRALTTETRGQNSWVNFGPHKEQNKTASGSTTEYAPQKTGLLPIWVSSEGRSDPISPVVSQGTHIPTYSVTKNVGTQTIGATVVTGVHFSQSPRDVLSSAMSGTGMHGAEQHRVENSLDDRIKHRINFYVDEGNGVAPESGVGSHPHAAVLHNVYDVEVDPMGIAAEHGNDGNAIESAVLDAGYDGVYVRGAFGNQGAVTLLGQHNVPVDYKGNGVKTTTHEYALLSSEIQAFNVREDEIKLVAPSAHLENGSLQFDIEDINALNEFFPGIKGKNSLHQPNRGGYNVDEGLITLLKNADLSTFLHEAGHHFVESDIKLVQKILEKANGAKLTEGEQQIVDDVSALFNWSGIKGDIHEQLRIWHDMTFEESRFHHENMAEAFEMYLFKGEAPSIELQRPFQIMKSWMTNVYKTMRDFSILHPDSVKINDDVRAVFDRMLATKEQIDLAHETRSMMPLFSTIVSGQMTPQELTQYLKMDKDQREKANEELSAAQLQDLQWIDGIKSKILNRLRAQHDDYRANAKMQIAKKVMAQPIYQAWQYLTTKQVDGGPEAGKLNEREVRDLGLGDEVIQSLKRVHMLSEDGMPIDAVAEKFGIRNGEELVRELSSAKTPAEAIDELTDQYMIDNHADIVGPDALAAAADKAIHNKVHARILATELRALEKMLGSKKMSSEAAKQLAETALSRMKVKDIKPSQYASAEARAARAAAKAFKAGDIQAAAEEKKNELVSLHATMAAYNIKEEVEDIKAFFKKVLNGKDENIAKRRDMDIVKTARAMLANFGYEGKATSAQHYIGIVARQDEPLFDILKSSIEGAEAIARPLNELTIDQLRGLHQEIQNLWYLSSRVQGMVIDGKIHDKKLIQDALHERMVEIGIPDNMPGEGRAFTKKDAFKNSLNSAAALLKRMESWVEGMDGDNKFGDFRKYVFTPVKVAADKYRAAKVQHIMQFRNSLLTISDTMVKEKIVAHEIGYEFGYESGGVAMNEITHALLHTGNESNKRKLLLGRGWATENQDGTLDTTQWDKFIKRMIDEGKITKAHYDFAQKVWDQLEETKKDAQDAHRDAYGKYFNEVTANEFTTPFGTYRGGYVPAMIDSRITKDVKLKQLIQDGKDGIAYAFPGSPKGFTKERVDSNKPLMLDLRTLPQHIDKVLLFSHMENPVRDARKLLMSGQVAEDLNKVDPVALESIITQWLHRAATQQVTTPISDQSGLNQFANAVKNRSSMSMMLANISNTAQQITGFSLAAVLVKPSSLLRATAEWTHNSKQMSAEVMAKSTYMKNRMSSELSAMMSGIDKILLDPNMLEMTQEWTKQHTFFMQSYVDNIMGPIVWTGAYDEAIKDGHDDQEAVHIADGVVRQTQGSTLPEDISRIESGPVYARILTQFYGYFNMQYNLLGTGLGKITREQGLAKGLGRGAFIVAAGFYIPAMIAQAIANLFRGGADDDDKDGEYLDDWLMSAFVTGPMRNATAMIPVGGAVLNSAVARFNSNPNDDKMSMSPVVSSIEAAVGTPYDLYKAAIGEGNAQHLVKDGASLIALVLGAPTPFISRPLGYMAAEADGKMEPTGPIDMTRGLLTGQVSPESRH